MEQEKCTFERNILVLGPFFQASLDVFTADLDVRLKALIGGNKKSIKERNAGYCFRGSVKGICFKRNWFFM